MQHAIFFLIFNAEEERNLSKTTLPKHFFDTSLQQSNSSYLSTFHKKLFVLHAHRDKNMLTREINAIEKDCT